MVQAIALKKLYDTNNICVGLKLKEIGKSSTMDVPVSQVYETVRKGLISISNLTINKDNNGVYSVNMIDLDSRMKDLVSKLNKAREVYEQGQDEIMTNLEYDKLYDELQNIEKSLGYTLKNSPTINVGYEVVSKLQKEKHEKPMLSLAKTKDRNAIADFVGDKEVIASWKMDGLTVVLHYNNGKLEKAVTRGNGEIGEIVTHTANTFKNIPKTISFKGKLVLRGEAVIKYSEFNRINDKLDLESKYKNPRNLCSGSVRQLDSSISAERNINWFAFELVEADGKKPETVEKGFEWLKGLGFQVVEYIKFNIGSIEKVFNYFSSKVNQMDIPSDGLVFTYNNVRYGESLGCTSKFPRHSLAFKWEDGEVESRLVRIDWQVGKTGVVTPVAVFEPVEIEGSIVNKASLHNLSIMKSLLGRPYVGQRVKVYKANMIIPNISWGEK